VDFSRGNHKDFSRGEKVAKFRFNHSKIRKQPFVAKMLIRKFQISKSRSPLSNAHVSHVTWFGAGIYLLLRFSYDRNMGAQRLQGA